MPWLSRGFTGAQVFSQYTRITANDTETVRATSGHWLYHTDGLNVNIGSLHVEVLSGTVGVACYVLKAGHSGPGDMTDLDLYSEGSSNSSTSTCNCPGGGTNFWAVVWTPSGANATLINYHNNIAPQAAYPTNCSLAQVGASWILTCTTSSYGCALHWGTGTYGNARDVPNCVAGSDVGGVWTYSFDVTAVHGQYIKMVTRGDGNYFFYPSSVVSFHA